MCEIRIVLREFMMTSVLALSIGAAAVSGVLAPTSAHAEKFSKAVGEPLQDAQAAIKKRQWTQALGAARGPLGELVSRKLKSRDYTGKVPGGPDGKYVVIQYDSVFEKKAAAVETVTPMMDPDGVWRVSGYFIR